MLIEKCPICSSDDLEKIPTVISDFVAERIAFKGNRNIHLCRCKKCDFGFYDYRFSSEEESMLYRNYRDEEYQKTREKYECFYTKKVNNALNNDIRALAEQKRVIAQVLNENGYTSFKSGLDYGGNEGATFFYELGTEAKYVFDISGVKPISGIIGINSISELFNYQYDFIMSNHMLEHCTAPQDIMNNLWKIGNEQTVYYIEVPYESPFTKNKFSIRQNLNLLFNPNFSNIRLAKYYFQCRKKPFMPLHEHINFFTEKSLRHLCESTGFSVKTMCVLPKRGSLGKSKVLSTVLSKNRRTDQI
jgi:hypothetical protein